MPEQSTPSSEKAKFAAKTALSLTLAYMLPMALGWPQPQTAAITVMLIAATGMVSESLQKGVLRIIGTMLGAVIGLTLIALFPQDRMLYLFCVSIAVSLLLYLYNAYQGDSTLFMLAAVVTLMVFNGGDAEGAFLYGIDRTLLTAFGVMVYTLVGSLLWPIKAEDNTLALAKDVFSAHHATFEQLVPLHTSGDKEFKPIEQMLAKNEAFQTHYVSVRNDAIKIKVYQKEWDTIASCFERLDELLSPALHTTGIAPTDYAKHILNYEALISNIESMFQFIHSSWDGTGEAEAPKQVDLDYTLASLKQESHMTVAAVVARADLLMKLQAALLQLGEASRSLLQDGGTFRGGTEYRGKPSFIWLDRENFKTSIRVFCTFWIAVAIWIEFNPPGGFMFVTLATVLVVLVSYTPVTPKLLFILFTLGFLFAVPSYVFLLPAMSHWTELALFLFAYAFIGFFVFAGPVSIFFLLGLMTLGIQNTMQYNFNVILILILLFYMICSLLIITVHFPFTSKPHRLYVDFSHRFFTVCGKIILKDSELGYFGKKRLELQLLTATSLLSKMKMWGGMIDTKYFPANQSKNISALNESCTTLLEQLKIRSRQYRLTGDNILISRSDNKISNQKLAQLCNAVFEKEFVNIDTLNTRLEERFVEDYLDTYSKADLARFYLFVNLQASILAGIVKCRASLDQLDWQQLQGNKI